MKNYVKISNIINKFNKVINVQGDKSISIRWALMASQAIGKSRAKNLLKSEDVDSTLEALKKLGVKVLKNKEYCMLLFRVTRLKKIVEKYKKTHTKEIGDYRASKCVVIPLKEIFSEGCYKLFD